MKVVLRADVTGVGKRGDIVDVSDGFGRNHLVPGGKAILATDGIAHQASQMRRSRDLRDAKEREGAEAVASKLVPMVFTIHARAGREGRLFGSVTPADIVDAVQQQANIDLDRHKLLSHEPIRSVGSHDIGVRLHADVVFQLRLEVVSN